MSSIQGQATLSSHVRGHLRGGDELQRRYRLPHRLDRVESAESALGARDSPRGLFLLYQKVLDDVIVLQRSCSSSGTAACQRRVHQSAAQRHALSSVSSRPGRAHSSQRYATTFQTNHWTERRHPTRCGVTSLCCSRSTLCRTGFYTVLSLAELASKATAASL